MVWDFVFLSSENLNSTHLITAHINFLISLPKMQVQTQLLSWVCSIIVLSSTFCSVTSRFSAHSVLSADVRFSWMHSSYKHLNTIQQKEIATVKHKLLLYLDLNLGSVHCVFFQLQSIASISPLVSQFISMEAPETCREKDSCSGNNNKLEIASVHWELFWFTLLCCHMSPLSFLSLSQQKTAAKRDTAFQQL